MQQGTNRFFYTRDHLGSIREVVNNSGAVVARYDYDPYGRRTKVSGTFDSDFGFTGHYFHAPSGLHLAPFRAYNAELGRWISRDPILEEGGINLYCYVSNNPVNLWDPLGLLPPGKGPPTSRPKKRGSKDDCPSGGPGDLLGKIWNLPNTVIGLAFGGLGLVTGADVSLGNNAIQFENHSLMSGAITLGNTISYGRDFGPDVIGEHERQHTYQGQQLGPLYLPSNAAGMAAGMLLNGHTHGHANWNERGPESTPPRPW